MFRAPRRQHWLLASKPATSDSAAAAVCKIKPIQDVGTLYATSTTGRLLAVSTIDGTIMWHASMGITTLGAPVVSADGARVYIMAGPQLYSLNSTSGHQLWRASTNATTSGLVLSVGGTMLFVSSGSQLQAFDGLYGTLVWARNITISAPVITSADSNALYIVTKNRAEVFRISDGLLLRDFHTVSYPPPFSHDCLFRSKTHPHLQPDMRQSSTKLCLPQMVS
jgi:outer membrane protein assembly factor BamB